MKANKREKEVNKSSLLSNVSYKLERGTEDEFKTINNCNNINVYYVVQPIPIRLKSC
jgi:hypothetical protein